VATTTTTRGTYQMLWDCPSCGTTKLLGVDHRHCPNCGAPQEENLRYFPSRDERVPTAFRGSTPDWECEHCGTPCAAADGFCMGCGAARGNSPSVHVRASIPADASETGAVAKADWNAREQAQRQPQRPKPATAKLESLIAKLRARPKRVGIGAGVVAFVGMIWFACTDKQVDLVVDHHSWTRTIPVERFSTLQESDWCSSMPADAREHGRTSEIHHYDKVPDGEDCRDIPESCHESCSNIDNGNGSFSEVCEQSCTPASRECTTRYRDVPVYADKCSYEVDRWVFTRAAVASGGLETTPHWPAEPAYSGCAVQAIGCERLGSRSEVYLIHFTQPDEEGAAHQCPFDQGRWESIAVAERWTGEASRLSNELNCETIMPEGGS
jgi:hypothetical protein